MLQGFGVLFFGGGVETTLALTIATAVVMSPPQPSRGTWCLAGLCLCCDIKLLKGLKGQSLSFPALHPFFADITRVTWRSQGTHITEAKPKEKRLTIDYMPRLRGQLFIHPTNLSLEIRPPKLGDNGKYEVVVDTLSDPTKPKTFSYSLRIHGGLPMMPAGTSDMGGQSRSTVGPRGVTEPDAGDTRTQGTGGGQPPDGSGGLEACGVQDYYCVVKAYLMATVFGLLLMLVATVHNVTRDKGT
ncbi:uncharacterized protein LOC128146586 [Harpia harpyja]|uniref:uncharacterized protein LOC128146586 n=1 Tax=Harpia harpyja TaxID=202280 RepID=UPI0022B0F624|nr:uncharacterized protein LOC128146586 [Harpia harpyja]